MRFIDISSGLRVPITNEEQKVCEMIKSQPDPFPRSKLSLREKEVARQLVNKGVIKRLILDDKAHFIYNEVEDWRG